MRKITTLIISILVITLSGCSLQLSFNPNSVSPTPTVQLLVGNDRDSHGCIGSAGYQWCAAKEKCLRVWEESCDDETSLLKTTIKQALVKKHGESTNELTVSVSKIIGDYASGGASASGGGGMWFAAKVNGEWKLVWDGNGIILCLDLVPYPNFPASFIPECYDQKTDKMVNR